MARTWMVEQDHCTKVNLLNNSDDNDAIWLENAWHEVSPTHAATLPSGTKMLDANDNELTLVDGYCTTYFYKGWQTVSAMTDGKIGNIIATTQGVPMAEITSTVGASVFNETVHGVGFQIVRLIDGIISLPNESGKNLISDLYPGKMWEVTGLGTDTKRNWFNQWEIIPLAPDDIASITNQITTFPRTFTIENTKLPGYGSDTYRHYYAPELFTPYMYFPKIFTSNNIYLGGIIVVIGVKRI